MIEHKDITDPNIHEPKGVSTAAANRVYKANGAGSGSWGLISTPSLDGLITDNSIAERVVVSDGTNKLKFLDSVPYGNMAITNNISNFNVTSVADTSFNTASQFSLVSGSGAPWTSELLHGITFNTDKLTVATKGIYKVEAYLNIGLFPSNTSKIAIRYRINGTNYSRRKPTIKSSGTGDEAQLLGFGIVALNPNDYVQLVIASDTTGSLLIKDCNVVLTLVKQLA